ncbi:MAG: hypothetical protein U5R31_16875 [Acidimicrobiia bacterium]|nr:hypothetical protein [Acidimicrobiia bacterium]
MKPSLGASRRSDVAVVSVASISVVLVLMFGSVLGVRLASSDEPSQVRTADDPDSAEVPEPEAQRLVRGEQLEVTAGEVISDIVINQPIQGLFDRTLRVALPDGSTATVAAARS